MRRSRFSEEQIMAIPGEQESGGAAGDRLIVRWCMAGALLQGPSIVELGFASLPPISF